MYLRPIVVVPVGELEITGEDAGLRVNCKVALFEPQAFEARRAIFLGVSLTCAALLGVPEMTPVLLLRESPSGNADEIKVTASVPIILLDVMV